MVALASIGDGLSRCLTTPPVEATAAFQQNAAMLHLRDISKSYDGQPALSPTDLHIASGSTTVLIGPSGCGKSTLLRLIVGLVRPDSGTVTFRGEPMSAQNILLARQRMGYVIQEGGLFPHMRVRDNVTLMARYLRRDTGWIEARLEELTDLVHLSMHLMDRYPSELSGGQRQRVSLMRALMLDPELLLLDEPLGALDPMIRYQLQQELRAIFAGLGKTVVMVTHDIAEAAFFADKLVLLRSGRIIQQGSIAELARSPADPFVTEFINAQRGPFEALGEVLA